MIKRNVILKIALVMLFAFIAISIGKETFASSLGKNDPGKKGIIQPNAVEDVKVNVSNKDVTVTWKNVNAVGYEVTFSKDGENLNWPSYNTTSTSMSLSNFPVGNGYTVTVRAYNVLNSEGEKLYSEVGDTSVARFDVVSYTLDIRKVESESPDYIKIVWDEVEGARYYECRIYGGCYDASDDPIEVKNCELYVPVKNLSKGVYEVRIVAKEDVLTTIESKLGSFTMNENGIKAPQNIRIEFIDGNDKYVLLKWDKVEYATSYNIDAYEKEFFSEHSGEIRDNEYSHWVIEGNGNTRRVIPMELLRYYFEITPIRDINTTTLRGKVNGDIGKFIGAYKGMENAELESVSQVSSVTPTVTGKKVKVNWAKVDDAEGYEVVFTSVVNKKTVTWKYNRKTTSISFSSFPKRNGYNVTVRAYKTVDGQKQYGDYSDAKTFNVK